MSGVPKVPISSRVKPSTKVLIDKSKYTSGEMLDWAAQQFTDEKELVQIKIKNVEDRIQNKKIDLIADEMELENLQKMWVKLNPESEECKELLSDLVDVESKDYAGLCPINVLKANFCVDDMPEEKMDDILRSFREKGIIQEAQEGYLKYCY